MKCADGCGLDIPYYHQNFKGDAQMKTSLYERLKAADIPIDNHESDLYFLSTPESKAILNEFPTQKSTATWFRSRIDGKNWVDVPFAFAPWWERRLK
jgi:hypothetical protein